MNRTGTRLSHRKQQIWVCVIAGLFLCDFIACGYLPSQQRLTSLQEARARQRQTIDMAAAQRVELGRLKTKLRETDRLVERFDASVPPAQAVGAFLLQITAVMKECDLTDQVVLPDEELQSGDVGCIPIHVTCKGRLAQLFGFFHRLEALDRLVRIEKVTMENDSAYMGELTLKAQVVIFYQSGRLRMETADRASSVEEVNHGA
jgi:Tfp pilus assembly protein PilO